MSKNNPCKLADVLNGTIKLAPMKYLSYIIYSNDTKFDHCIVNGIPTEPTRWSKHTAMFDNAEVSLTYNQVNKFMQAAVSADPDCMVIAFNPRNYFIVRDKIETDYENMHSGQNKAYIYTENNDQNFNYLK